MSLVPERVVLRPFVGARNRLVRPVLAGLGVGLAGVTVGLTIAAPSGLLAPGGLLMRIIQGAVLLAGVGIATSVLALRSTRWVLDESGLAVCFWRGEEFRLAWRDADALVLVPEDPARGSRTELVIKLLPSPSPEWRPTISIKPVDMGTTTLLDVVRGLVKYMPANRVDPRILIAAFAARRVDETDDGHASAAVVGRRVDRAFEELGETGSSRQSTPIEGLLRTALGLLIGRPLALPAAESESETRLVAAVSAWAEGDSQAAVVVLSSVDASALPVELSQAADALRARLGGLS